MTQRPLNIRNTVRLNLNRIAKYLEDALNEQGMDLTNITQEITNIAPAYDQVRYNLFDKVTLLVYKTDNENQHQTATLVDKHDDVIYWGNGAIHLRKTDDPNDTHYLVDYLDYPHNHVFTTRSLDKRTVLLLVDLGGEDYFDQPLTSDDVPLFEDDLNGYQAIEEKEGKT